MIRQVVCLGDRKVVAEFHNRQPECWTTLCADNADFRDYGDRQTLAGLGIFSIDRAGHRCARRLQALREQRIADAYVTIGLDRRAIYRMVAQEVQNAGLVPDGCWPRSTGAYAARRDEEDEAALRWAERIRVSEQYAREIAGDYVVNAVFSLGA